MIDKTVQLKTFGKFLTDTARQLVVVSDFDETIVNKYVFHKTLNTHLPLIEKDFYLIARQLRKEFSIPLFICTARGSSDPAIKEMFKLTQKPVVIENGGALFMGEKVELLISDQEIQAVKSLKTKVTEISKLLKEVFLKKNLELIIRLNRSSDVEFRIQHFNGSGFNSEHALELYGILRDILSGKINYKSERLKVSFSGSTLSIMPTSVSKASGLKKLLIMEGLSRKEISLVVFGDNENDKSIMNLADFSINVGNKPFGIETLYLGKGEKSTIKSLRYLIKSL